MSLRHKEKTWVSAFFVALPTELKLFWQFIIDHADQAGFFDLETHLPRLTMLLSAASLADAQKAFEPRVCFWSPTLWQIKGFIPEQYPRDYTQKLNGAMQGALKALLRYSSVHGTGVLEASFSGVPLWPELRSDQVEGGSSGVQVAPATWSQVDRPGAGSTGLQEGPLVGRGWRGRKGRRSTPHLLDEPEEVQGNSAPVKALEQEQGGSSVDVSAERLLTLALDMTFARHGILSPDWPPFVVADVVKKVDQVGADAVSFALRAYLNEGKHEASPIAFNRKLSVYLALVPLNQRRCRGPHTYEGKLLPRDDFDNGPKLRAKVCGWCKHTEPTGKTVEASTERPVCAHDWQPEQVDQGYFNSLSAESKATVLALERCAGCGDVRDSRMAVAA